MHAANNFLTKPSAVLHTAQTFGIRSILKIRYLHARFGKVLIMGTTIANTHTLIGETCSGARGRWEKHSTAFSHDNKRIFVTAR